MSNHTNSAIKSAFTHDHNHDHSHGESCKEHHHHKPGTCKDLEHKKCKKEQKK